MIVKPETNYYETAHEICCIVYGRRPYSQKVRASATRLLLETCATESHFIYRRQGKRGGGSLPWDRLIGAWGIAQTEHLAVYDSLEFVAKRRALAKRSMVFLFGHENADFRTLEILSAVPIEFMRLIAGWDRLALWLCRVHYFRQPEAMPLDLNGRAAWYKEKYNTAGGAGSVSKYKRDCSQVLVPRLKEWIK